MPSASFQTTSSICSWNQTKPFGQGKLSAVKVYVGSFSPATRHATVRPVASVDELTRTYEVIAAQFPERHSTAAHGLAALEARFQDDRTLMLVAVQNGVILGG